MAELPTSPNGLSVPLLYVPGSGYVAFAGNYVDTDGLGNSYSNINVQLASQGTLGSDGAFWGNATVAAAGVSGVVGLYGTCARALITARASAATNLTIQVSTDNVNWYTLTQDNSGTAWTLALTAAQLNGARDLIHNTGKYLRLVSSAAATITAGLVSYVS